MKKKPKVFVTRPISKEVEGYLTNHCELEVWRGQESITRKIIFQKIVDVEGILTTGDKIDAELLDAAPNLKIVSNIAVGYNNFDLNEMKKRNIMATNAPKTIDNTVADLVLGLMIATARRMTELDNFVKKGLWKKGLDDEELFGTDIFGSKVGIIGLGGIGEAVAKRAKLGFDMEVSYYNRTRREDVEKKLEIKYVTLNHLLQESDFVVLLTPLTKDTIQFMNKEQFERMKKGAIFINASRGMTVNEEALIGALKSGRIKAAGLDVYEKEPISNNHPFLTMPNVVTMPHIGAGTKKARHQLSMVAAENLVKGLKGEIPPNLIGMNS
ncbi:2-hydroxyacid dehydrogenase [Halalkalibacter kiskunsagensis]|uniref:2-hydroxyacid dehydrogenase n=1 Tax=Halalkalibacter kiskunsagensis TaxID=1548599 RepID=A0ABV6KFS4_9BACI